MQAVELVQRPARARVRDEVVDAVVVVVARGRRGPPGVVGDEGRGAREAVVAGADGVGVGQSLAAQVGGEAGGEVFEGSEGVADGDRGRGGVGGGVPRGGVVVEEERQEGLRRARVLDHLRGEEERRGGGVVVGPVRGPGGVRVCGRGPVGAWVFEEEDDAVQGL